MGRGSLSDRDSISLWLTPILKHGAGIVAADVHNDGNGSLLGVRGLSLSFCHRDYSPRFALYVAPRSGNPPSSGSRILRFAR